MLSVILNIYRIKFVKPRLGFYLFVYLLRLYYKMTKRDSPIDFSRFTNANQLSCVDNCQSLTTSIDIELIIIAKQKDFEVLSKTIAITLEALSNFKTIDILLIVPQSDLVAAHHKFGNKGHKLSIVNEFEILNANYLNELTRIFSSRDTWVYQQALKLNAVANSELEYTFVLDADTVLLNSRNWICSEGHLLLCPSDEYNADYYNFLNKIGVSEIVPKYTFVSHHMFYNTKLVKQILHELDLELPDKQIETLYSHSNSLSGSPVCIDYELFGQWMARNRSDNVRYLKWSNIGISKKNFKLVFGFKFTRLVLSKLYNSASFHSWS